MYARIAALLLGVSLLGGTAHANVIVIATSLSGAIEAPPNASPGTGSAVVTLDTVTDLLRVQVTFSGLLGTTTASHIHCCFNIDTSNNTAGVATTTPTFLGFPLGVTSGSYDQTLDLNLASSYNPAFITAA